MAIKSEHVTLSDVILVMVMVVMMVVMMMVIVMMVIMVVMMMVMMVVMVAFCTSSIIHYSSVFCSKYEL